MTENLRRYPRKEIEIEVELRFLEDNMHTLVTRNMSEGGLFICVSDTQHYPLGEMVSLRFDNPLDDFAKTEKDAIIVRLDDDGIAVAFVEIDET
jgi:hypothetical protein